MARRISFFGVIAAVLFCCSLTDPAVTQALPLFGQGDTSCPFTEFKVPPGQTYKLPNGVTLKPGTYSITQTEQQTVSWDAISSAAPGDLTFKKTSFRLPCSFAWGPTALTMSCTDGTNTLTANYNFAFIETVQANKRTEQVMVYVRGNYDADFNGIQKNGGISSGLLSGTEKKDKAGNITSTSLSGTLYGAVDNDSTFQVKVRFTLTTPSP